MAEKGEKRREVITGETGTTEEKERDGREGERRREKDREGERWREKEGERRRAQIGRASCRERVYVLV